MKLATMFSGSAGFGGSGVCIGVVLLLLLALSAAFGTSGGKSG